MKTKIFAHAKAENAPDNSHEYIEIVKKVPVSGFEIDVQLTLDNHIIGHHDVNFTFADNEKYIISEYSRENLKKEIKKHNLEFLTLEEGLDLAVERNQLINLDVKNTDAIDTLINMIIKKSAENNVFITGVNDRMAIKEIQEKSNIPIYVNLGYFVNAIYNNSDSPQKQFSDGLYDSFFTQDGVKEIKGILKSHGLAGINEYYKILQHYQFDNKNTLFKKEEIDIIVWTVDNEEDLKYFIDSNIYGITTNSIILACKLSD